MRTRMEYGSPGWYRIQHTRDHGNARSEFLLGDHSLGLHINYIAQFFTYSSLQRIKNPNYKGKWKTPWIDNPGKQIKMLVFYVYSVTQFK
jgi:hypothetical protein